MTKRIVPMVVAGAMLAGSLTVGTASAAAQPVSGPVSEQMRLTLPWILSGDHGVWPGAWPRFPDIPGGGTAAHKRLDSVLVPGAMARPNTLGVQGRRLDRVRPPIRHPNG